MYTIKCILFSFLQVCDRSVSLCVTGVSLSAQIPAKDDAAPGKTASQREQALYWSFMTVFYCKKEWVKKKKKLVSVPLVAHIPNLQGKQAKGNFHPVFLFVCLYFFFFFCLFLFLLSGRRTSFKVYVFFSFLICTMWRLVLFSFLLFLHLYINCLNCTNLFNLRFAQKIPWL